MLNVVNPRAPATGLLYKTFPKNITVHRMKQIVRSLANSDIHDISLFIERENGYKKLDELSDVGIGELLLDDDTVYFIEDKFFSHDCLIKVKYSNNATQRLIGMVGSEQGETVLTLKLRTQEQFGFPVSSVNFFDRVYRKRDNYHIQNQNQGSYLITIS